LNKLVSIIVPCYNQAQYLPDALESVLAQTYSDWECIIVNDSSPDNTEAIAREWCEKDKRFQYIHKKNGGVSSARNVGIKNSSGKFILPLDADDKISVDYLRLAVFEFEKTPDLKLVYGQAEFFGQKDGVWKLWSYSYELLLQLNIIYCSAIYKRSDYEEANGYDELMINGLEDWEFWISLLKSNGKIKLLNETVFYYRIKDVSRNKMINTISERALYDFVFTKHLNTYLEYFDNPIALYAREKFINDELNAIKESRVYKFSNKIIRLKRFLSGR